MYDAWDLTGNKMAKGGKSNFGGGKFTNEFWHQIKRVEIIPIGEIRGGHCRGHEPPPPPPPL